MKVPNDVDWEYAGAIYQPYQEFVAPKSLPMTTTEQDEHLAMVARRRDKATDDLIDKAIFECPKHQDKQLREYYQKTGKRFWCLSPRGVSVIKLGKMEDETCDIARSDPVFKTLADVLLYKRTAQTPLRTPDGTVHYPRDRMPGLLVHVDKLGYANRAIASTVAATVTELLRSLYTIKNNNDAAEVVVSPDTQNAEGESGPQTTGAINFTIIRALWMVSFDYASYRLLQREDRTTISREDVLVDGIAKAVRLGHVEERQELKKKAGAGADGGPNLGAAHTEYLRDHDVDGGLAYLFAVLCRDEAVAVPSGRSDMAHFVMFDSPVLHRMVQLVHDNHKNGERTLIVVNNPWMQQ